MIKPIFSTHSVNNNSADISSSSDLTDQLKTLNELYKSGVLTEEEFKKAKDKLLN